MEEMNVDKAKAEIALQARFFGKDKKMNGRWFMSKSRENYHKMVGELLNSNNSTFQKGESNGNKDYGSSNYKGGNNRGRRRRWKNDKSNVQCSNCQKLGRFASECHAKKNDPKEAEANFARQEDNASILLMVIVEVENNAEKCS